MVSAESLYSTPGKFSRRSFVKATIGLSGGVLAADVLSNMYEDLKSPKSNGYPEGFFEREDLIVPSANEIRDELRKTKRSYFPIELQHPEKLGHLFQLKATIDSRHTDKVLELNFNKIFSTTPSETVYRVRANDQARYVTIISSQDPEATSVLFDPFDSEDVTFEVEPVSEGKYPLGIDHFENNVSISAIAEDCLERDIQESVSGILPRDDNKFILRHEAPYNRKTIVYYTQSGERIYLNRPSMICEKGGTSPEKLYEDTRIQEGDQKGPGRTVDIEWDTEIIREANGGYVRRPRIQLPGHRTGWYTGLLYKQKRPLVKIVSLNNNFNAVYNYPGIPLYQATQENPEIAQGFFLYKPEVLSQEEYDYQRNRPNRFVQWTSLNQLIEIGKLKQSAHIVYDFASYYPNDIGFLLQSSSSVRK